MHYEPHWITQHIASNGVSDPHWTAYVSAIALPTIALIAAWIAFRQSQIARNKLRLDLFDKRMEVYKVVRDTLGCVMRNGRLTSDEQIAYLSGTRTARWLFDSAVWEYVDQKLWGAIVDLELHNSMIDGSSNDERTKHIHARKDLMLFFGKQYKEFDKLCASSLRLRH